MADIETVINGLNDIGGFIAGRVGFEQARDFLRTIDETIALLKEQEAVEPEKENDGNPEPWTAWWYVCGDCGQPIDRMDRYCRRCGKQVKWNE